MTESETSPVDPDADVAVGDTIEDTAPRPVTAVERISSVDCLRGFALCGILLMNIEDFALPHYDPTAFGDATTLNVAAWTINLIFVDGTMRAIFSMLFGAGVILLTSRAEARGGAAQIADVYYRRLLWLLMLGLVHGFLLLGLDILYDYALVGLFLYPFRKVRPWRLILAGLLILAVTLPKGLLSDHRNQAARTAAADADAAAAAGETLTDEQEKAQKAWAATIERRQPEPERIREKIEQCQSGYWANFKRSGSELVVFQSTFFYHFTFWDVASMMLLGMGLLKLGIFSAQRSTRSYIELVVAGYALGLPLRTFVAYDSIIHNFDAAHSLGAWYDLFSGRFGPISYHLARLCVAMGHVGVLMLICKGGRLAWLTTRLAALGRMALSNYFLQTVFCTLLLYGYGFGMYGRIERYQLFFVCAVIWAVQLLISPVWLRFARFGPLEWLWRSLTYWKRQPFRAKTHSTPTESSA